MKAAQEILLDGEIARRAENEREKRWANALAARRAAIWPHIISIVVWPVLAVTVLLQDRTVKFQPVFFLAPVFFFGAIGQLVAVCTKRQRAWLLLIEKEAPELYAKLK